MKVDKTNYNRVAEIDGVTIFENDKEYFIWEHYPNMYGGYTAIPVPLGKTAKEVEQTLKDINDWNYRAWHGEMDAILKAQEQVRKLPEIKQEN